MNPTSDRRALAVLILGAVIIGVGPVLVRTAQAQHIGSAGSAFWRVALALPILSALALREWRGGKFGARVRPSWAALVAGVLFAGDLVCWHYGIRFTSVANATVLSNLTPILVTGGAWFLLRQAPRGLFLAGMAMAIAGSATMALAKGGGGGTNPHLGDALSVVTAVWYAGYFIAMGEARRWASAPMVLFWSSLIGAPLLLAVALALGERIWPTTGLGWAACVGLGLMHVGGQGSIAWALGRLQASLAAVVVLVQPVVAAICGWLAFGEGLSPLQALGGALALAGVAVAQAYGRRTDP